MAMAGAAAFLRSVATKMARVSPSPRLPSAPQHHGHGHGLLPTSSNRLWFSSSSASTGSTPQPTIQRGPKTYNKKVPSGNEWDWFIAGVKGAAPTAAYGLVFSGSAFVYFYVNPALDRINGQMDALRDNLHSLKEEMKQRQNEMGHAALDSMGSQIEARDEVGQVKEHQ